MKLFGRKKEMQTKIKELQLMTNKLQVHLTTKNGNEQRFENSLWERQLKTEGEYQQGLLDAYELFQKHCRHKTTGMVSSVNGRKFYFMDLTNWILKTPEN